MFSTQTLHEQLAGTARVENGGSASVPTMDAGTAAAEPPTWICTDRIACRITRFWP